MTCTTYPLSKYADRVAKLLENLFLFIEKLQFTIIHSFTI